MCDLTRPPMLTPEVLLDSPPPSEPVRFSLRDTPERQRNDLYREFFGRHYPAMPLVEVKGLYDDDCMIEIEGVAVID